MYFIKLKLVSQHCHSVKKYCRLNVIAVESGSLEIVEIGLSHRNLSGLISAIDEKPSKMQHTQTH